MAPSSLALSLGADEAKLRELMKDPAIGDTFSKTYDLANKLSITGTPSYVVGNEVVFGALGKDVLLGKIAAAKAVSGPPAERHGRRRRVRLWTSQQDACALSGAVYAVYRGRGLVSCGRGLKVHSLKTVFVLNGPNLNALGKREPAVTLAADAGRHVEADCAAAAGRLGERRPPVNHEGDLVDWLHRSADRPLVWS